MKAQRVCETEVWRPLLAVLLGCGGLLAGFMGMGAAAEPQPNRSSKNGVSQSIETTLTPAERTEKLDAWERLKREAAALCTQGDYDKAAPVVLKAQELSKLLFGENGPEYAASRLPGARKLISVPGRFGWSPDGTKVVCLKPAPGSGLQILDVHSGAVMDLVPFGKDPAWSPGTNWIVFVREIPGKGANGEEIWIVEADGGSLRKLCDGGFPTWSSDGKTIFFHSRKERKIMAVEPDVAGSVPKPLFTMPWSYFPAVAPDGKRIAFLKGGRLIVVDREARTLLATCSLPGWNGALFGWSPDGKHLTMGSYAHANRVGLWILDLAREQLFLVAYGPCTLASWSADGSKFAWSYRDVGKEEVWAVGANASGLPESLGAGAAWERTARPANVNAPELLSGKLDLQGRRQFYDSLEAEVKSDQLTTAQQATKVVAVSPPAGNPPSNELSPAERTEKLDAWERLKREAAALCTQGDYDKAAPVVLKAQGLSKLLFGENGPEYAASLLPGARKLISVSGRWGWSPDGTKAVCLKVPSRSGLQILDIGSGATTDLLAFGKDPAWSPAGDRIVFVRDSPGKGAGGEEIWVVGTDGGNPRKLCDGGFPSWSSDGKTIFFHSRKEKKIMAVEPGVAGSVPKALFAMPWYYFPAVAPDGKRIAFLKGGRLIVVDREARTIPAICSLPGWNGVLLGWSPDGRRLAMGSFAESNHAGLWGLDLARGRLLLVAYGPCTLGSWSADGSKFAWSYRDVGKEEVWAVGTNASELPGSLAAAGLLERSARPANVNSPELPIAQPANIKRPGLLSGKLGPQDEREFFDALEAEGETDRLIAAHQTANAVVALQKIVAVERRVFGPEDLELAASLEKLAALHYSMGEYAKAEPLYGQALEIKKKVLGENHADYARSLHDLANLYVEQGDYPRAEPLYRRALAIKKKALGENHPDYGASLHSLATLYNAQGDYARAEPLFRQALEIAKKALGENHPNYAACLNSLADLYSEQGDYPRAVPLFRQASEIYKKVLGENDPAYAAGLNNLAITSEHQGDLLRDEPLLRQALEINKKVLGEGHPAYAASLESLALRYANQGDYRRAEPLLRQALEIRKKVLGENHPLYAGSLYGLSYLYHAQGDYRRAEPLLRQALEIWKKALGEGHPMYARGLDGLAGLYQHQGDYRRADLLYRQALEINQRALGENHPACAFNLHSLATLYLIQGDYSRGQQAIRQAVTIIREHLEAAAVIQSERQQLAMYQENRWYLDHYLALVAYNGKYAEPAYRELLAWKGMVLRRNRLARAVAQSPELAATFTRLQGVARQLTAVAWGSPDPRQEATWRQRAARLSAEKEELEAQLSARSAEYRQAKRTVPVEDLQAVLSDDSVLVDFVECSISPSRPNDASKRVLLGFVVTPDRPVETVLLGAMQPINEAIRAWRRTFGMSAEGAAAASLLRLRLWTPIEKKLHGAKIVLISPDGALGQLPFGALPGKTPGTYLVEERTFAVVPVPQLIPQLAQQERRTPLRGKVLLLGNVDYDAPPDKGRIGFQPVSKDPSNEKSDSPRATEWMVSPRSLPPGTLHFDPLPGTESEIAAIEELCRRDVGSDEVVILRKSQASKEAFLVEARRHGYLHLATHGFFIEEKVRAPSWVPAKRGCLVKCSMGGRRAGPIRRCSPAWRWPGPIAPRSNSPHPLPLSRHRPKVGRERRMKAS